MNAERMKIQTNQCIDIDKLSLDLIKGNFQVVATERSCSIDGESFFKSEIVLPDGITLTVKREGWVF